MTLWLFSSIFLASMHLGIFSICASILFLRYWIIFTIITLSSFFWWIGYLHLVVFLGFYLVPSSGIYSSAVLSYLTFCDCSSHSPGCSVIVLLFFFLLLLSALWYMRLSMRLVKSSWWKGLIPAFWRVELVLAPLMGRAVLRKILKSLSVDR